MWPLISLGAEDFLIPQVIFHEQVKYFLLHFPLEAIRPCEDLNAVYTQ